MNAAAWAIAQSDSLNSMVVHYARTGLQELLGPLYGLLDSALAAALVRRSDRYYIWCDSDPFFSLKVETLLFGTRVRWYQNDALLRLAHYWRDALGFGLYMCHHPCSQTESYWSDRLVMGRYHVLAGNCGCCIDLSLGPSRRSGVAPAETWP